MSEQNRALAERWMNDWNSRDNEVVQETVAALMASNAMAFMEGATVRAPEDFFAARRELLKGFPDLALELHERVAERDIVALRWQVTGTHDGTFLGVAPTGQRIKVVGSTWFYFQSGQWVLAYDTWNQGELLNQLRRSRPARATSGKRKKSLKPASRSRRKPASRSAARLARKTTSRTRRRSAGRSRPKPRAKAKRRAR